MSVYFFHELKYKIKQKHTKKQKQKQTKKQQQRNLKLIYLIIIIMYIYHALINTLSAHMIHINLNMIFYTHVKHSPTKTIYKKYYFKASYFKN